MSCCRTCRQWLSRDRENLDRAAASSPALRAWLTAYAAANKDALAEP
mgnify:FL=1